MPLNWQAMIKETLRRRKEEGLNQKEHAAMANVSIPTMIDFERGITSISLKKAMDILDVVGLLDKEKFLDSLAAFSEKAEQRWRELVDKASQEKRFKELGNKGSLILGHSAGYFTYAYEIKYPAFVSMSSAQFLKFLEKASQVKYSGWTPFNIFSREELKPYPIGEGLIECWLKGSMFMSPGTTDFWWASSKGFMHLHRGYHEDGLEGLSPGKRFDLEGPILRAIEMILHARRMARLMAKDFETAEINIRANYKGLSGRVLMSQGPVPLYDAPTCLRDSVDLKTSFQPSFISLEENPGREELIQVIYDLLKELYASFGFYELQKDFIAHKVNYLVEGRWG